MLEDNSTPNTAETADHPMSFLLEEDFYLDLPQSGEIREGQVVAHRGSEILIDIGAKSEGIIPSDELDMMDQSTRDQLTVGNMVSVLIVNPEDRNGNIILSYTRAMEEEDWINAENLLESQDVYLAKVIGYNKGGLLVMFGQVRGFIPASQLGSQRRSSEGSSQERLRNYLGEELSAKVIEVDRSRNRLILSERAAMKEIRASRREKLLDELEEGEIRKGRIVNLAEFGAFVDIGGIEGLVHLSELSWKRVNHPSDLLKVGSEVEVYILGIDRERNRVALSLKRLEPDPWTVIDQMYQEGELVEATVTKLTRYGAFARLNDDFALEGLIHVSELSDEHVNQPQDVIEVDQIVTARIIRIDPQRRQLGLSLKQVMSAKYLESDLARASDEEE